MKERNRMSRPESYRICRQIMSLNSYNDYHVNYILSKNENDNIQYQAYAVSNDDPEDMICVLFSDDVSFGIHKIVEWDFNVDDYLLSDLENDFKIDYMPLEDHYNVWWAINERRDEIEHQEGLYQYLSHCQQQGITKETINLLGFESVDISDLYQERNYNYRIIADMSCGNLAVVLGYNPNGVSKFVTWRTTKNRIRGYDIGHYFDNFKSAYADFENRCHYMMEDQLTIQKNKSRAYTISRREKER